MKVKLDKNSFNAIDGAFLVLKEANEDSNATAAAVKVIKENLNNCFDCKFEINIIGGNFDQEKTGLFLMSVYPEVSTIDKIIAAILSNKETDAIKKLWEANKVWTIEIDQRLIKGEIIDCSNKELTAMLLHEVGHVVCSSSLPNRISLILRYEIAKTSASNKMMLKNKIFSSIMSLPVLDACISEGRKNKSSIKEEIKADTFVKKMGYQNELLSVLTKISQNKKYPTSIPIDEKIVKTSDFTLASLDDFQKRKEKLAKTNLLTLKEHCCSPYINGVIDTFIESVYDDNAQNSLSLRDGRKTELMQELADKIIMDGYTQEFFLFGGKELKRIDPAEIDYIEVKMNEIKTDNDKMMLISYIHSKLDLVEYYISILSDPKLAKKYIIPHTMDNLLNTKKRLLQLRDMVLKFKIPERNKGILVAWPVGYEG